MTDRYLVLTRQSRLCATCKAPTWWVTNTQLSHGTYGLCLDHAWRVPGLDVPTDRQAYRALMATFDVAVILDAPAVDELNDPWRVDCPWVRARVCWTFRLPLRARHVGPCSRCRRRINRYGVRGSALCPDCHNRVTLTKGPRP
jgi:hypothetical protein